MKRVFSVLLTFVVMFVSVFVVMPQPSAHAAQTARYSVLVLDVSGKETFTYNGVRIYSADTAVEYVRTAAHSFLSDVINAKGENYVALVTYTSYATVVSEFTNDIAKLTERVNSIRETGVTDRNIAAGLDKANELITKIENQDALKNVVLFTTGMTDDGKHSDTGRYGSDIVGNTWYRSDTGINLYKYANVAHESAQNVKKNATLYTLGLFQTMEQIPQEGKDIAEFFKLTAKELATSESCFFDASNPSELEFAFEDIAGDIMAKSGLFKYAGMINEDSDSVGEYWYSDLYFFKRASLYNPSLATMSLCLELSSWSSHDKNEWYNPNDPNSLEDKLVNAKTLLMGDKNAKEEGYSGLGFGEFSANEDWESEPTNDSIGVCVARKQIYRNEETKANPYTLVAVIIRGGGYYSEWSSNFKIGEEGNHQGFHNARQKVINFVRGYLEGLKPDESKNIKLWIVGYSRSGAVANMVAGEINDNPDTLGRHIDSENLFCYTFEAPQGVLKSNATGTYYNIHNILNANDIVPMVAPSAWGFVRYNYTNTTYLPTRLTTEKTVFDKKLEAMKQQLAKLGYDAETMKKRNIDFSYRISEMCTVRDLYIDKSKWFPGGEPLWWSEESEVPSHAVLQEFIDLLADDLIENREFYVEHLQYCISEVLGIVEHYRGIAGGLDEYGESLIDLEEFKNNLLEFFTLESMMDTLSPMFSLNPFYGFDDRVEDVKLRAMKKLGSVFEAYAEIEGFVEGVSEIITRLAVEIAKEVWNNNTDAINTICKFINVLVESGFQPHYPEICLAWCRSLDSNYITDISQDKISAVSRVIRINCPVNISVYDESGNVVASIIGDTVSADNQLIAYVNNNGEKIVYLPGDGNYNVQIEATDNGEVNYSVGEFNFAHNQFVRVENYYDVTVTKGDNLSATVPAASNKALKENAFVGTDAEYKVSHNGRDISCSERLIGRETSTLKHTVTIAADGNGGYVSGAGRYIQGHFAQVEAHPHIGCEFYGWYDASGAMVSTDATYRFAVKNDVVLTAKFSQAQINEVSFVAQKGGTVTAPNGYYPKGAQISIVATPSRGYSFVGWQTDEGEFVNASATETDFIMPGSNAKVTAVFEPKSEKPANSGAMSNDILTVVIVAVIVIVVLLAIAIVLIILIKKRGKQF